MTYFSNAPGLDFAPGAEFNPGFGTGTPTEFFNPGYFAATDPGIGFSEAMDTSPGFGLPRNFDPGFGNTQPQESGGNWLDRLGGFARDITPLLYGAGSIIEGIKGVPRSQSRFAGFNQGNQYDMLARSLGYQDGREFIESNRTGVKPSKEFTTGESVVKPSYPKEDLTKFRGGEGAAVDERTLGLNAVLRGANEYGISPREFVEMGQRRNYEFGPEALRQLSRSSVRNSRDPLRTLTPPGGQ